MSYLTIELITRAYSLAGIVSQDLQEVSGNQLTLGLRLLNELLSMKSIDERSIPYYKKHDINSVIGQEGYFVPNLISVVTLTFLLDDNVRYSMISVGRQNYFGSSRVENIKAPPFSYHCEREIGGSRIYVYYLPDKAYPLQIWGKFSLPSVELNQDLLLIFDLFYISYLRYALAEYICNEYNISVPLTTLKKLNEINNKIIDISPMDLTLNKLSNLQSQSGYSWAFVNLGRGYTPS